jgi:hypothetical protein
MDFDRKFWAAWPGDEPETGLYMTVDYDCCANCGRGTRWNWRPLKRPTCPEAGAVCSEECLMDLIEDRTVED